MNAPFKHSKPLKLVGIGNSTGVVFPKEMLAKLGVGAGDQLFLVETADGLELRKHDPEFEEQMRVGREVMKRHRAAMRELAK